MGYAEVVHFFRLLMHCKHLASEHRRCHRARNVNALKKNPFEADDEDEETTVDGECAPYSSFCDVFRMQAQTLKKCHHYRDLQSGALPKIVTVQLLHLFLMSVFADLHSCCRLEVKVRTQQNT